MAQCINLKFFKKTTKVYEIVVTNKSTGLAEDITGWTFYFYIKSKVTDLDVDAKLAKVITDLTEPLVGKTLIPLTVEDTDISAGGNYSFSLDYKDAEDVPNEGILAYGKITSEEALIKNRV